MLYLSCVMLVLATPIGVHEGLTSKTTRNNCGADHLGGDLRCRATSTQTLGGLYFARAFDESLSPAPSQVEGSVPNPSMADDGQWRAGGGAEYVTSVHPRKDGGIAKDIDSASSAGPTHDTRDQHSRWRNVWRGLHLDRWRRPRQMEGDGVAQLDTRLRSSLDNTGPPDFTSATQVVDQEGAERGILAERDRVRSVVGLDRTDSSAPPPPPPPPLHRGHIGDYHDYKSHSYLGNGRSRDTTDAVTLSAEEGPRHKYASKVQAVADDDSNRAEGVCPYPAGDEYDKDAKGAVEHVEEAVYGEPEPLVIHGCVYCKDAQPGDGHTRSPSLLSSSSSSWFSRSKRLTGPSSAPSFEARQSGSSIPGSTTWGASTVVNREVPPHASVTQNLVRNAQAQRQENRCSYPTLRELVHQLEVAHEEERRAKQMCFSAMTAAAAARDGVANSSCYSGGREGTRDDNPLNVSSNVPLLKEGTTPAELAAPLRFRTTSLDWVQYLRYVPMYSVEAALKHLEHEQDDETSLLLFYAPDLFNTYNYVQWIGLMVKATCLLLRSGALDPITYIRDDDDDDDVGRIFSSHASPSDSTQDRRGSGNDSRSSRSSRNNNCGTDVHCNRRPPHFCRNLVLPSLEEGLLRPGDIKRMRDNRVRIAIVDGYHPWWNVTEALLRGLGRQGFHAHRQSGDFESSDGGVEDHYDETDATRSVESAEAPTTSNGVGGCGGVGDAEKQGRMRALADATVSSAGSSSSLGLSTPGATETSSDPASASRTANDASMFLQRCDAFLSALSDEGGVLDDIREAFESISWSAQQGGDTVSTAEATERVARDVGMQRGQGCDDFLQYWTEQHVLQRQQRPHTPGSHAHRYAMLQSEVVAGPRADRAAAVNQAEAGHRDPITVKAAGVALDAGLPSLPSTPPSAEGAGFNERNRISFLARCILDHSDHHLLNLTSDLLDTLQDSLDCVRQWRQRLVEKVFSWGQIMKYRLHANVSAQRMGEFASGHLCDLRCQATGHLSHSTASTAGGGDAEEGTRDEEGAIGDDDGGDDGLVQSPLDDNASCSSFKRLRGGRSSVALSSASAPHITERTRVRRRKGSPTAALTPPSAGETTPLSMSQQQQQQQPVPASPTPSSPSPTPNSADALAPDTLRALATSSPAASQAAEDDEAGEDPGEEHDEVFEDLKCETANLEGDDAGDVCGAHALGVQCEQCMYKSPTKEGSSSTVRGAWGGGTEESTAETSSSTYTTDTASIQEVKSSSDCGCAVGKGAVGTRGLAGTRAAASSVSDRWRRQDTTARRQYLLRQSPPVLLFPRKQGSYPYFFPQTLLRLVHVGFPESRGQLSPHEHARRMQCRWGCIPVSNTSSGEGAGVELPKLASDAPVMGNGGGGGAGTAGEELKGAWTASEVGGQCRNSPTRSCFGSHRRGHSDLRDAAPTPPSASTPNSPMWSTYRVVGLLDNPFSRIAVEHLQYDFLINGPSSPTSIVELLVEESKRASTPGELEIRAHREDAYRLRRRQWLESHAGVSEEAAPVKSREEVDEAGGSDDPIGSTEVELRHHPRETAPSSPKKHPHHVTSRPSDRREPWSTVDGRRLRKRFHQFHQRPLNSSDRPRDESEDFFFEHDISFRLDPVRFIESAPLTLNFFLRTPAHVVEEEVVQPLRQRVEALRRVLLDKIVSEAYRYGRCEFTSNRYMQLLTYGADAVYVNGTRQPALTNGWMAPTTMAHHSVGQAVDVGYKSSASYKALDDDGASTVPYGHTVDGKPLLLALRSSTALRVWRSAGDHQRQSLKALRASHTRTAASASATLSSAGETLKPIPLPHDLISVVELLHQPYDVHYSTPSHSQPPTSSSSVPGRSVSITDAAYMPKALTSDYGDGHMGVGRGVDDLGAGLPFFPHPFLMRKHAAMSVNVSDARLAEGSHASLPHQRLHERTSMLQMALHELLRQPDPGSMNSFFQMISIDSEAALLVDPAFTESFEFTTTTTTAPNRGSAPLPSPPRPPECLKQYNATYLAVTYLFFNGTAEAYFRAHFLNRRRLALLQRLDEAIRLARQARLILLTATEEDYRAQYVDAAIHDADRRFRMFGQARPSSWTLGGVFSSVAERCEGNAGRLGVGVEWAGKHRAVGGNCQLGR